MKRWNDSVEEYDRITTEALLGMRSRDTESYYSFSSNKAPNWCSPNLFLGGSLLVFGQNSLQTVLVTGNQVLVPVDHQRSLEELRWVDIWLGLVNQGDECLVDLLVLVLREDLESPVSMYSEALKSRMVLGQLSLFIAQQWVASLQHRLGFLAVDLRVDIAELVISGHLLCIQVNLELVFVFI